MLSAMMEMALKTWEWVKSNRPESERLNVPFGGASQAKKTIQPSEGGTKRLHGLVDPTITTYCTVPLVC